MTDQPTPRTEAGYAEWVKEASNALDREGSTDWDNTRAVAEAVAARLWNYVSEGLLPLPAQARTEALDVDALQRYSLTIEPNDSAYMELDPDGRYVLFEDVEAAAAAKADR